MPVITRAQARAIAERIFAHPVTDWQLDALARAEAAGHKIEGFVGYVATCHIVAAYEAALDQELDKLNAEA